MQWLLHATNDLQELWKTHETVSRAKTEIWHLLMTHHLPLYFPEAERFNLNSRSDRFLDFLERFPTPSAIYAHGKQDFIKAAWPVIGRNISKERLLGDIYETARRSIALPAQPDSVAIEMFKMVLAQGRALGTQRDAIEERAHSLLSEHADYQLLTSFPGIGPINALTILAEAGDLRRFAHYRQFLEFCGFNLST